MGNGRIDVAPPGRVRRVLKRIFRAFLACVFLAVVVTVAAVLMFQSWKADIVNSRASDPDRRIINTELGEIEYADIGQGVPMLVLHGTPGGYDQGLMNVRAVPTSAATNIRTISVSRPGYRGTPLDSGRTFEDQSDLFAAMLDEIGVDRVVVLATSGGGYAGLQFAIRHPDRTIGLILSGAEVRSHEGGSFVPTTVPGPSRAQIFVAEIAMWAFGDSVIASSTMADFNPDDPEQASIWRYVLETAIPFGGGDPGRLNDIAQRMNPAIDSWPLDQIRVPTLFLHGDADDDSSYDAARAASVRMSDAEFVTFEGGDHFVGITRRAEYSGHIERFIRYAIARNE